MKKSGCQRLRQILHGIVAPNACKNGAIIVYCPVKKRRVPHGRAKEENMEDLIRAIDGLPWALKIIFCIPALDIIWAVYRIVKGVSTSNTLMIVVGILWIVPGCVVCWIVDLVTTLLYGQPKFFA